MTGAHQPDSSPSSICRSRDAARVIGSASDVGDTFLAKLDPFGDHVWSKTLASEKTSSVEGVAAADPSGNVLFAGGLSGAASLGGAGLPPAGSWDVVVAKFAQ